ncbi:MAG: penicillin-binding protein activator LpoB [Rhodospirillaceae bacterium]|nr:penicillin-binding protein activator LpoB [Rhodospirillaceae bacterium]
MKTKAIRNRFVLLIFLCALVAAGPIGCGGGTKVVSLTDPAYSSRPATGGETTFGLDYRDFEYSAKQAVDSFLSSPLSDKPGSDAPWVMAISRIINDTTLNIDTDQLVKKIRIALLNSGRVVTTTAVAAGGPEDAMSAQVRELEDSDLFNQDTVAQRGTMVAPELSLSGKIIQRTNRVGSKQQVDYYFQLTATNITTGLAYWEFEEVIAKLGSNSNFSWES